MIWPDGIWYVMQYIKREEFAAVGFLRYRWKHSEMKTVGIFYPFLIVNLNALITFDKEVSF